jgi:hypothetical protein
MINRSDINRGVINRGVINRGMIKRGGIISLLSFFLLFLLITPASAIGIGASPEKIEFGIISPNKDAIKELHVINTGSETEHIKLTVEGAYIGIDPEEFDLNARQSRAVNISINPVDAGEYKGNILITAHPTDSKTNGLGLGAGVRIPVSFVVNENSYVKILTFLGLFTAIVTVVLLWVRLKKK